MANTLAPAAQADQSLKNIANGLLNVAGRPPESAKTTSPLPASPIDLLTDLYLPGELKQVLEETLKTWEYELEPTETYHQIAKSIIRHYVLRTAAGKIVLIYLKPEIVQDPNPSYWGQFHYFGTLFANEYHSIFVFSNAENAELAYKEVLRQWKAMFKFEKVEFLLQDAIQVLQNSPLKVVVNEIRDIFGLPEEIEAEEQPEEEKEKVAEDRVINTRKLHELLNNHFSNNDDLIQLCFDLQEHELKYENLEGDVLKTKFISLISHFENRGILPILVDYCKKVRENISWDDVEDGSE